ncbi:MAG TPA: transcription termination factor NusA [Candidatus Dormibacteraeota bacterium]|nr:transcription termination factor NusA [Candidatus Dormibacteraeota bacterium]
MTVAGSKAVVDNSRAGELGDVLRTLREIHGVPTGGVVAAIEAAIPAAWSQLESSPPGVDVRLDPETGELVIELTRTVVAGEPATDAEISLERALALNPDAEVGVSVRELAQLPKPVAARAARLVKAAIGHRVREARRERLEGEAEASRGLLVASIVERVEGGTIFLRAGQLQAYLPREEQIRGERLIRGRHLKVVLMESRPGGGEEMLQVRASRANALLLRRLLEAEVPELAEGSVVIRAITREPGERSKVAVESLRAGIDPKGACIGPKGVRIRSVVADLNGEKVDVLEWSSDPAELVARALAPAPVLEVHLDQAAHRATALVASPSLSLAIGKEGQNARLAARLTGWRIDIRAPEEES